LARFATGKIRHGGNVNSYDDDPHDVTRHFDFVHGNQPLEFAGRFPMLPHREEYE